MERAESSSFRWAGAIVNDINMTNLGTDARNALVRQERLIPVENHRRDLLAISGLLPRCAV